LVDLAERVKEIDRYHQIELPGGIVTPGVNGSAFALSHLRLPSSLARPVRAGLLARGITSTRLKP
jgi:hypothetical protein